MWTYGGIRIFVLDKKSETKPIIAKLQPVTSGTVWQFFGWESEILKLPCKVVGEVDSAALLAMSRTGTAYELTDYAGNDLGDYYLLSYSPSDDKSIRQTLRSDLDCDAPVYSVDLELGKDE